MITISSTYRMVAKIRSLGLLAKLSVIAASFMYIVDICIGLVFSVKVPKCLPCLGSHIVLKHVPHFVLTRFKWPLFISLSISFSGKKIAKLKKTRLRRSERRKRKLEAKVSQSYIR